MDCFVLLDDRDGASRLYTGHVATLLCEDAADLPKVLDQMQEALRSQLHAVALLSYELGAQMQGIAARGGALESLAVSAAASTAKPVAKADAEAKAEAEAEAVTMAVENLAALPTAVSQVLLFSHCELLSATEVAAWLQARSETAPAGVAQVRSNVDEREFANAIARIHAWIEAGDTYQINYTYRLRFDAFGGIHALYARLRQRQPVPYGALLALPDGGALLSLSPELFVRHEQGLLTARPMKGTAAASGDKDRDAATAIALAADPKNRAENLMIVDLLRNDLGRIARIGSVAVPALFEVNRFAGVLQMTSTVTAQLRDHLTLHEVFAALFPCGSITGAPKRRTMQIIRELEPAARGWYTGAIGWFAAPEQGRAIGDFCLSVPIRTLCLAAPDAAGLRRGEMGVGAGIVFDSRAEEEFEECRLKARFLTGLSNDFELFETMHATKEQGCRAVSLHLRRLATSAAYFGFAFDPPAAQAMLDGACAKLSPASPHRLRLALHQGAGLSITCAPLAPLAGTVQVFMATESTRAGDLFLRHKSSVRDQYDAAWRKAEALGGFDMLFFNERGELTEGGRSNVFLQLDGQWCTPPLSCGVLPGVMRAQLLADPALAAVERVLTKDDLRRAQHILLCNSLRGALPATLVWA